MRVVRVKSRSRFFGEGKRVDRTSGDKNPSRAGKGGGTAAARVFGDLPRSNQLLTGDA